VNFLDHVMHGFGHVLHKLGPLGEVAGAALGLPPGAGTAAASLVMRHHAGDPVATRELHDRCRRDPRHCSLIAQTNAHLREHPSFRAFKTQVDLARGRGEHAIHTGADVIDLQQVEQDVRRAAWSATSSPGNSDLIASFQQTWNVLVLSGRGDPQVALLASGIGVLPVSGHVDGPTRTALQRTLRTPASTGADHVPPPAHPWRADLARDLHRDPAARRRWHRSPASLRDWYVVDGATRQAACAPFRASVAEALRTCDELAARAGHPLSLLWHNGRRWIHLDPSASTGADLSDAPQPVNVTVADGTMLVEVVPGAPILFSTPTGGRWRRRAERGPVVVVATGPRQVELPWIDSLGVPHHATAQIFPKASLLQRVAA
jgi:hypothetical protein